MDTELPSEAHRSLKTMFEFFTSIGSTVSQFLVILKLMRAQDSGVVLPLLCMTAPLAWETLANGVRDDCECDI